MAAPKGKHPVAKREPPLKPFPPPVALPAAGDPGSHHETHEEPHLHHANVPFVAAGTSMAEITVKAILLGIVLSVVLGGANTYLGLKAGLTFAAAIPASVVSLAVLRLFRKHTILENNMVQTIASAGSAVASGMLFTIPALLILGAWDEVHYAETTIIGVVGGLLGVLFTVPLRRALIVEENLAFPEGVATAEVLKSGEGGGSGVGALILGGVFGLAYKLLQSGFHLFGETISAAGQVAVGKSRAIVTGIGTQLSAALLGVGYIIGLRVSLIIFAGSMFAWLVAMPLVTLVQSPEQLATAMPENHACHALIADSSLWGANVGDVASCLYKYQVRYLGVGAMLVGGVYSLYKLRGPLWRAVTRGLGGVRGQPATGAAGAVPRTEVDLSPRVTFSGIAILLVPMFLFYAFAAAPAGTGLDMAHWNYGVAAVMALIMLVTGFLFSAVGAYMAGIVGSSNNPISGVTILTLIVAAGCLKFLGLGPDIGAEVTIFVAAVICIAGSIASDNLQDLKAGYMLGATPRRQQMMIAIGAVISALFLAPILNVLISTKPGSAGLDTLSKAPQANLMASISSGIFGIGAGLPYVLIGIGVALAFGFIALDQTIGKKRPAFRIPIMAVAVGMYLPIDTTAPIFLGGLVAWVTAKVFRRRTGTEIPEGSNKGVLFASGLIAGEALLGIVIATLAGITVSCPTGPWIPGVATINYACAPMPDPAFEGILPVHYILDPATHAPALFGNAGQFVWLSNGSLAFPGLLLLGYMAFVMGYVALRKLGKAPRDPFARPPPS